MGDVFAALQLVEIVSHAVQRLGDTR